MDLIPAGDGDLCAAAKPLTGLVKPRLDPAPAASITREVELRWPPVRQRSWVPSWMATRRPVERCMDCCTGFFRKNFVLQLPGRMGRRMKNGRFWKVLEGFEHYPPPPPCQAGSRREGNSDRAENGRFCHVLDGFDHYPSLH
ncbi:MAG: hypothetical protein OEY93_09400 [Anaerolineae bacterium]|nr:hypothetical protein [Anaerolineae bacterium]